MNILVANDDGIDFPGIKALAVKMQELGEVTVISPAHPQSGMGHAFSFNKVIHIEKIEFADGIDGYKVEGTPVDCVAFGINGLVDKKFDLIVTGINEGQNIANDCVASGTCGSACCGFIYGIPAIAFSQGFGEGDYDYEMVADYALEIAKWFIKQPFNKEFVLNVNVPHLPKEKIKGYKVVDFGGIHTFHNDIEFIRKGKDIYVDTSVCFNHPKEVIEDDNHDIHALNNGYIVIEPISVNLVDKKAIELLKQTAGIV